MSAYTADGTYAEYQLPDGPKIPQPHNTQTPDWVDVRQEDPYPLKSVPVKIDGFVFAQMMPAKRGIMIKVPFDTLANKNQPSVAIDADPRIKRAIVSASVLCTLGTIEQIRNNGTQGFDLPANFPIPLEGINDPLYVIGSAAGTLSVRLEFWAD